MPCCVIAGCSNHGRNAHKLGISFHRFPKDKAVRKQWLHMSKRADDFNIETARVCSCHFNENDFERDLRSELLGYKLKKNLKKDSIPHLRIPTLIECEPDIQNERSERYNKRESKKVINSLLGSNAKDISLTNNEICSSNNSDISDNKFIKLQLENNSLKQTNESLLKDLETAKAEITSLKVRLKAFEGTFSLPWFLFTSLLNDCMHMDEIKFSAEEDDRLIELVSYNPILFNPQVENYKNINVRDDVWKSICQKLNKNGIECKKRWKHIRDSYNRFKRKRKLSTGSAAPAKHSKCEFFKRLEFLETVPVERTTISNVNLDSEVLSSIILTEQSEIVSNDSAECINETPPSPVSSISCSKVKRKWRNKKENSIVDYMEKREKSRQQLVEKLFIKENDDITSFGNYVSAVLRKLNPQLTIQAKNELFSVLTKYESMTVEMEVKPKSSYLSQSVEKNDPEYAEVIVLDEYSAIEN